MAKIKIFSTAMIALLSLPISAIPAKEMVRLTGNVLQVSNPVIAGLASTQEMGALHFGAHYIQTLSLSHALKFTGSWLKPDCARRPNLGNYSGMPSGHTVSAWSAASYSRLYSKHDNLTYALYGAALFTGASRMISKHHTFQQVLVAAMMSELVNELNHESGWLNYYATYDFDVASLGITIKL